MSAACCSDGSARTRLDNADDWHVELLAQRRQCVRRRGVARDDDALHAFIAQKSGDLPAVTSNGVGTLRAIRHSCGVAEVDDALVRKLAYDFFRDGQSTNPRIKHTD